MARFVNAIVDLGIRFILGSEMSKSLLLEHLNNWLNGKYVIKDLLVLNKENNSNKDSKTDIRYVISCDTTTGEKVVIEMSYSPNCKLDEQILYSLSQSVFKKQIELKES